MVEGGGEREMTDSACRIQSAWRAQPMSTSLMDQQLNTEGFISLVPVSTGLSFPQK